MLKAQARHTFETEVIYIPCDIQFGRMSELVECTDIGFSSKTLTFSASSEDLYREALKVLKEEKVTFYML